MGEGWLNVWNVVKEFLGQEDPQLAQYQVELSELSADNAFFKKTSRWVSRKAKSATESVSRAASRTTKAVGRAAVKSTKFFAKGARALGKIVATIAGKIGESCS